MAKIDKNNKNLPKKPKSGGTPANEKNIITSVEFINEFVLKNLYSDRVRNNRVSKRKKTEKKNTNEDT